MADPITIGAILLPTLLSLFGGGGRSQTTTGTTETPRRGFQWPGLPAEVTRMYADLLGNREMYRGWGQPAGMTSPTAGLVGGDWMQDLIKMLEQAWPDIMAGYGGQPTGGRGVRERKGPEVRR